MKTHAVIRMMYKQRFFQETEPKLIQGFNAAKPGNSKNGIFYFHHALLKHFSQTVPMILRKVGKDFLYKV